MDINLVPETSTMFKMQPFSQGLVHHPTNWNLALKKNGWLLGTRSTFWWIPQKKSLVVSVVSFLYVSGIANPAEEIPGTPNNQCSMDVWSFQTTFPFVQVWFIIQLKREIKNWFFMVPGNKLLVEEVRIYMFSALLVFARSPEYFERGWPSKCPSPAGEVGNFDKIFRNAGICQHIYGTWNICL